MLPRNCDPKDRLDRPGVKVDFLSAWPEKPGTTEECELEFSATPATQQGMADKNSGAAPPVHGTPPWQAKTVWIAASLSLLGLILWVAVPKKGPPPSATQQATLAEASGDAVATRVHSWQGSPALFRFGLSYIAGFFLGYGLRRFVKMTLLLTLLAAGVVFVMRYFGWLELDWGSIENHLSDSFGWMKGQAEALKVFLTGYVPSAGAAGAGIFMGLRWH